MRILITLFTLLFIQVSATESSVFNVIYHGSSKQFELVRPHPSFRKDEKGTILWQDSAIFASFDKRIALFYTHNRIEDFSADIDLVPHMSSDQAITYSLKGGKSLEEALNALYGKLGDKEDGFIYLLDGRYFITEPGIGSMERICRDVNCNIGKVAINRREEIEHYRKLNLIHLNWNP